MPKHQTELQRIFYSVISGLKRSMVVSLKEHDQSMSPLHFLTLRAINELEDCTALTLAERTQKDKGQITRLIKYLITNGLVQKVENPDDKRSQFIMLTDEGLTCFNQLNKTYEQVYELMGEGITEQELEQFIMVGTKIVDNLKRFNQTIN